MPIAEEEAHALIAVLKSGVKMGEIAAAGSVWRRRDTVGDLDILTNRGFDDYAMLDPGCVVAPPVRARHDQPDISPKDFICKTRYIALYNRQLQAAVVSLISERRPAASDLSNLTQQHRSWR